MEDFLQAARLVDVFSPNHIELGKLFGCDHTANLSDSTIEELAQLFLNSGYVGSGARGTLLVRAGERGCCVARRDMPPQWLPPFYRPADDNAGAEKDSESKVIDPTGAGNAFLGGFAVGYRETQDVIEACCYGAVASSFALEQIGLPRMEKLSDGEEIWNGFDVRARLHEYRTRLHSRSSSDLQPMSGSQKRNTLTGILRSCSIL